MHPGEYLFLSYVEPYKISHEELARRLGVPIDVVDGLIAETTELSSDLAVRLELVFDRSAESWLNMQVEHSLAQARQTVDAACVDPFVFPPRADAA